MTIEIFELPRVCRLWKKHQKDESEAPLSKLRGILRCFYENAEEGNLEDKVS